LNYSFVSTVQSVISLHSATTAVELPEDNCFSELRSMCEQSNYCGLLECVSSVGLFGFRNFEKVRVTSFGYV